MCSLVYHLSREEAENKKGKNSICAFRKWTVEAGAAWWSIGDNSVSDRIKQDVGENNRWQQFVNVSNRLNVEHTHIYTHTQLSTSGRDMKACFLIYQNATGSAHLSTTSLFSPLNPLLTSTPSSLLKCSIYSSFSGEIGSASRWRPAKPCPGC